MRKHLKVVFMLRRGKIKRKLTNLMKSINNLRKNGQPLLPKNGFPLEKHAKNSAANINQIIRPAKQKYIMPLSVNINMILSNKLSNYSRVIIAKQLVQREEEL